QSSVQDEREGPADQAHSRLVPRGIRSRRSVPPDPGRGPEGRSNPCPIRARSSCKGGLLGYCLRDKLIGRQRQERLKFIAQHELLEERYGLVEPAPGVSIAERRFELGHLILQGRFDQLRRNAAPVR